MRKNNFIFLTLLAAASCTNSTSTRDPNNIDVIVAKAAQPIYLIARDDAKGTLLLQDGEALKDEDFPLHVGVSHLSADKGVQAGYVFEKQIQKNDLGKSLAFDGLTGEFVVSLHSSSAKLIDVVRLINFPAKGKLIRSNTVEEYCALTSKLDNECASKIPHPATAGHLYHLGSLEDFNALASKTSGNGLRVRALKFVIDTQLGNLTHFTDNERWDLHYGFVREVIERKPNLDRCNTAQKTEYDEGWYAFSRENYDKVEGRRYYSGSISLYSDSNLYTVEFNPGDNISAAQIEEAFNLVKANVVPDLKLKFRPATEEQNARLANVKLNVPRIPLELPYQNESTQLLSPGETMGKLTVYTAVNGELPIMDMKAVAILKNVPNDISFVGGIISSQFQSPLSHVNVLSRNRGTPHLVIKDASNQTNVKKLIGKYVSLKVTADEYELKEVTAQQVEEYWNKKTANQTPYEPVANITHSALIDLATARYTDSDKIGAKAANFAELARVNINLVDWIPTCAAFSDHGLVNVPEKAFGIPFYWYVKHLESSGAKAMLETLHTESQFRLDADYRALKLKDVRKKIKDAAVDATLMNMLTTEVTTRFGNVGVRFRSSTNVEDLENFNGAGLYESKTGSLSDPQKTIAKALKDVWASMWLDRAWQEREYYRVNHLKSVMGVLVHESFPAEAANGVAISRNVFNPNAGEHYTYVATQLGEESIVSPEGSSVPDEFIVNWFANPEITFLRRSNLTAPNSVLTRDESLLLGCYLRAIHKHFKPIFGTNPDRIFAMDTEFKIDGNPRELFIKQARPYIFGESAKPSTECR